MKKINFAVEDAKLVNENPNSNFAVLSLDFFASGDNLHELYVSEETLMKTAETIKNVPLVWKYDSKLDDIYTHDPDEVPCGFVPENATVESRVLEDGRTMLSVVAYVWKRYSGQLMEIFKRDGGKKPVSVEMTVFEYDETDDRIELTDFRYECITILGTYVTPAIPLAHAKVISCADLKDEFLSEYQKEFSAGKSIDMTIPDAVRENAKKALKYMRETNEHFSSVAVSTGKFLASKRRVTVEKAKQISSYFERQDFAEAKGKVVPEEDSQEICQNCLSHFLHGGNAGKEWAKKVLEDLRREKIEKEALFMKKPKLEEGLSDAELQEDGAKKNETVVEMAAEDEIKEEEKDVETADFAEEEKEEEEEEEKEEEKEEEEFEAPDFAYPDSFDFEMAKGMFADEDDDASEEEKMSMDFARAELEKGEFCNPQKLLSGMYTKMCRWARKLADLRKERETYMAENEELRAFKAKMEEEKKQFAISETIASLEARVVISPEAREEMIAEADKYSYDNIEEWRTFCKAFSFDFPQKKQGDNDVEEEGELIGFGLPWSSVPSQKSDLWS